MTSPLVLCIDRETYCAALAALGHVMSTIELPPDLLAEFAAADADLRLAMRRAFEREGERVPALLRRQI
ncbi:MAG TPA: hypothetical protein VGL34_24945 [Steroidobacteraceae bacterium]|jgi:hypothetical protein